MSRRRNKNVDPSQVAKFKPWVTVLLASQHCTRCALEPKPIIKTSGKVQHKIPKKHTTSHK